MAVKTSRRIFKPIVFTASLLPLAWLLFALYSDTVLATRYLTNDPVQKLDRELGDWALIFIIITLIVRPARELFGAGELIAYFYVLLHVSSYVFVNLQFNLDEFLADVAKRPFITIGVINLVLLTALAATSPKAMIRRMGGRNWRRLHMLIYLIAVLGLIHFIMMIRADFSRPYIYGACIAILLGYRVWRKRASLSPARQG
ncbi:MAG: protein-methionine-sulfoxide reductase heme-binding subunit MsrQ [Rhodospirillales bacterium]|jgi:sulfoxide reductase heme-binding subunit YedZ|nr:sulfoxide reductase heme-binding subunit YedZ [Rhodospirillaceae bacterium]MDP6645808.1 protein-methionine-sulfoxide reductase heme-binding subunit MsrQ [Rhodospirillales bacterium]MDP6843517.1 protein-methionine-sulfoxide reductase heme-binding subunit MsrQ [Rhodospirillales bacterium]|tara:strand:+ start:1258 stop:1860 length:603 start_codon:yes stop_codon:yes gene_type:complete